MYFEISEFASYLWVSAFRTKLSDLDTVLARLQENFPNVSVQFLDLDKIAGSRYALHATLNALRSFHSKRPISRTLGMEILLYMAANRQVTEALKLVGLSSETRKTAAVLVGKSKEELTKAADFVAELLNQMYEDSLVDDWSAERIENVRSTFGIGEKELEATMRKGESLARALERLATERSALLTIRK